MSKNCKFILTELGSIIIKDEENIANGNEAKKYNERLLFAKKFTNAVSSFILISNGDYTEISSISDKLRGYDSVFCNDVGVISFLRNNNIQSYLMPQEKLHEISKNKLSYLIEAGFANNNYDAHSQLRRFAIDLSSNKVKRISEKLDLHISQSINSLDELDKIINTIGSRLREWYGLHFPELDNLIQNILTYAEIVRLAGNRKNINSEILKKLGLEQKKSDIIVMAAQRSKGGDLLEENLSIIKKLADEIIMQTELRRVLVNLIDESMEKVAPNVKQLLTATVGARLIAKSGSLSKLSTLPASTIQILGAEKALFRSLKTGAPPPKHGILFQHPTLHSAPKWQRGKMARTIAAKLAIAARIDFFRKGEKDSDLLDQLNKKIAYIQEKYKEPRIEKRIFTERSRDYLHHKNRADNRGLGRRKNRKFGSKFEKKNKMRFSRNRS
ncbi:MAG: NOP5/NOP56 family protein [Nitrososphaeraceae archaeon]